MEKVLPDEIEGLPLVDVSGSEGIIMECCEYAYVKKVYSQGGAKILIELTDYYELGMAFMEQQALDAIELWDKKEEIHPYFIQGVKIWIKNNQENHDEGLVAILNERYLVVVKAQGFETNVVMKIFKNLDLRSKLSSNE